jgi:MscS family membrane protein
MRAAALVLTIELALAPVAFGQATTSTAVGVPTTTTIAAPEDDEELDLGLTSPRSATRGFLVASRAGDYQKAADYLDLRAMPKDRRATEGPVLARRLRTVLDRTLLIDVGQLSDSPEGDHEDGLPARRERVGSIKTSKGNVDVVLERVPLPDGTAGWKFASSVVALVPQLYADFGDGPFASRLPDVMLEVTILELRLWQWVGMILLIALGALLGWLTTGPLLRLLAVVVPEDRRHQSARLLSGLKAPLRLLVTTVVFAAGQHWLALGITVAQWVTLVRKTLTTLALTWLWLRVVDVVGAIVDDRLRIHGRAGAVGIVPLLRRTIKIFVAAIAVIVVVQNLGYDATGILAGLGVGGLALALAAQKTVENLFGGVMVIADQPVRVGDVCRFGNRIGTVEEIGFRSTRVRTPERSLVSIPNAEFSSTQIENLSVRDRMLLQATFGVKVGTSTAALRKLLPGLRRVIEQAPRVDPASISVRVVGLSLTSIDVEVVAYIQTRDWNEFLGIREDTFLAMLDVFDGAGLGLTERRGPPAAPTRA